VFLDPAELSAPPLGGLEVLPRASLAARQLVEPRRGDAGDSSSLDVGQGHRPHGLTREPLDPPDRDALLHRSMIDP
jgi:hypothetical protein